MHQIKVNNIIYKYTVKKDGCFYVATVVGLNISTYSKIKLELSELLHEAILIYINDIQISA
ncbi:hypothetical protein [Psychroflexus sp. ALD_RP9]|uniref:hypothetical protein n=1 Tax=Psychroflexus sp. ALD_RP9 TaxID=2777186 RepID=UPI001A8D08B5|nr:hypothetical protein [Psychroflexus sp. ALD_RP9]QSS96601.1 hypothetical protein IMZ30_09120 [Psychroflexus sp. ALD_RP9]